MSLSRAAIEGVLISHGMSHDEINRALAPAPQIIRTVEELEALDPLTVVYTPDRDTPVCAGDFLDDIRYDPDYADDLPAVKVVEGAHLRACREALEGADRG